MMDFNCDIGSHLMEGFGGTRPGDPGVEIVRSKAEAGEIGGVILFNYNIEGPDQLEDLTRYVASWHIPDVNRPLLVAVDQEGGNVERLARAKGFRGWPSAAQVGSDSFENAESTFRYLPEELARYGINVNFAPVIDVARGPQSIIGARGRSFAEDPAIVASLAARAIREHRLHGVIATVKHFPGLGACTGDTHQDLIDGTSTWTRSDLIPYRALLAEAKVDAVMSTHMVHFGLEGNGMPLTFSRSTMKGILRDELGFEGVLFTDDLGMGSIVHHYDLESVVKQSLLSGHDMLVFGQNTAASAPGSAPAHAPIDNLFARATSAVQSCIEAGQLTEEDLKKSAARLRQMRNSMLVRQAT